MKVSQLIELLKDFKSIQGDQEIFITASGYYCTENVIEPDYPEKKAVGYPAKSVWSIGHSHQSYQ